MPQQRQPFGGGQYKYGTMEEYLADVPSRINAALAGLGGYQEPGAQTPPPFDPTSPTMQRYQQTFQDYGLLGLGGRAVGEAAGAAGGGTLQGVGAIGGPVAEAAGQVGRALLGEKGASMAGQALTGNMTDWLYGPEAEAGEAPYQPPPPGPQSIGMETPQGAPQGAFMGPAGMQLDRVRETQRQYGSVGGGGGRATSGAADAGGASMYDLQPYQEQLLAKYGEQAPQPVPAAPESEQLLRVLGGLAAGASGYQAEKGGLARAIAGAGAGGMSEAMRYREEARNVQLKDQEARREFELGKIALESGMRERAAELELKRQLVVAEENQNSIRMISEQAKEWRAMNKVTPVGNDYGVWLVRGDGAREFVPNELSVPMFIREAKNIRLMGGDDGDATSRIIQRIQEDASISPAMKDYTVLATIAVERELDPPLLQKIHEGLEDDPEYEAAMIASLGGDENAAAKVTEKVVNRMRLEIMRNPALARAIQDQVGNVSSEFGQGYYEKGLGTVAEMLR